MKLRSEFTCPLELVVDMISGKWKSIIIWRLRFGPRQLSKLRRDIVGVNQKMLIQHLNELMQCNIVDKITYEGYPLKVKYFLTEFGFRLIEPLDMLQRIGIVALNKEGKYLQKKGYIHVYTGDGKGKTTSALGLAFRSIGAGFKVMMVQFLKNWHTSELESMKMMGDNFHVYRIESKKGFTYNLNEEELKILKDEIKIEFEKAKNFINSEQYDLIILDEILGAVQGGFIDENEVIEIMKNKPESLELVLTGRNASDEIINNADLVSKIENVKHYYDNGILARIGIEY